MEKNSIYTLYLDPTNEYRGKPFWCWNGKLEKEELIRQIHILKEMGFGGFFMHSRTGLQTEYLGDEWFDLINTCAEEAEKLGMEAWIYDEDRWPSGTAGGIVTKEPRFRLKFIRLKVLTPEEFEWSEETIAAFSCELDDFKAYNVARLTKDEQIDIQENQKILHFSIEEMAKESFYNGYTYVDTLNREATDQYLKLTHEKYKSKSGKHLGKAIKGIFTDEPHRGSLMDGFGIQNQDKQWLSPWTYKLFDAFKDKYGYDLVEKLPELFLQINGEKISQVKWHYVDLLQEMFIDNFAIPMHEWCKENNLILTGHILHEDNLTAQTAVSGSVMRYYEHMDYPGVDVLTEGNVNYWIVKQLSSVARQIGQKWLLSELYGCTGWQMPLESHKSVGDWQTLFGINLRCHHLSWYTMEGEAKRDYPSSISFQSTWWKDYEYVETYFSRLGVIMSQGEPECHVLMINPVESVWAQVYPGWSENLSPKSADVQQLEKIYEDVFHWLSGARIDFDYGDEEMISRLYEIDQSGDEPILKIGKASYKVVVVAGLTTIRQTTIDIIKEFLKVGGKVIFAGNPPEYVNAVKSEVGLEIADKAITIPLEKKSLIETCQSYINPTIEVIDSKTNMPIDDIYAQVRIDGEHKYILLMNMNRHRTYKNVRVIFQGENSTVEKWDSATGSRFNISTTLKNGKSEILTTFYAADEHLYVIKSSKDITLPLLEEKNEQIIGKVGGSYSYKLSEDNVCVLDMASYQIDGEDWQSEKEILKVDREIRKSLNMPYRSGDMIQPWYREKYLSEEEPETYRLKLNFSFNIQDLPTGPTDLVIERPDLFHVAVNGQELVTGENLETWIDHSLKKIPIPHDYLAIGENHVLLETAFHEGVNLEAIYLLGSFGVQLSGTEKTITNLPEKIEIGDLTTQGFPFYSGIITYQLDYEKIKNQVGDMQLLPNDELKISFPKFEAACLKVHSHDTEATMIAWQPYEANITEEYKQNKDIQVDVILTRRNTFGPLHLNPVHSPVYGPDHFITEGDAFSEDYKLIESGLLETPLLKKESSN